MAYIPRDIEKKWKQYWDDNKTYKVTNDTSRPKYYVLDMFPYPSGAGLHVGHPLGYIASDIYARYKRMRGFNVLHPMGFDAFGLPAEQYAVQMGVHPAKSTADNIVKYRAQLDNLGFSFDWDRQVNTSNPKYYRWTQWIFLQLFQHYYCKDSQKAQPIEDLIATFEKEGNQKVNAANSQDSIFSAEDWNKMSAKEKDDVLMNYRLGYRKVGYVNWCEALGTVLANDEVKDGVSERGGHPVEKKPMRQWSLRITAYAERLLSELDSVDWSDSLKTMQSNWIGRSEGAQVFFNLENSDQQIEVFTTRPDTIFGATYMVLAPEHPLVDAIMTEEQRPKIEAYRKYVNTRSERDRMADVKEVTGEFTGAYANNPFTKEKIPVWIGEYVLMDYGTGAIMAVPSDDDRDKAFATKFNLKIVDVVDKSDYPNATLSDKVGKIINSGEFNGMEVKEAISATIAKIEEMGIGTGRVNYKLRDANFSRQRYWGEPYPIKYDADGVSHAIDISDLPVELPNVEDYKPTADGKSPLAKAESWVNVDGTFVRETDTMPGYAGSSWYFLRYMDPDNNNEFASQDAINYWQDVDLYVGGTEHAVGHLMYSRFWHKFLYDKGLVPTTEPFKKLVNQGMIQGVIEFMYLKKEKTDGRSHFVCAKMAKEMGITNIAKIPVHVDFVQEYGSPNSHMNAESIKQFIEWRPDYANAIFECQHCTYKGDELTSGAKTFGDCKLYTHSEVGKMSKRYFNVVNPDDVVERYGSDCFRMYEMFLGPIEQGKPWDTKGIDGVSKFLRKFWALYFDGAEDYEAPDVFSVSDEEPTKDEMKVLHTAIKKVNDDIERFSFNTCISAFMVATNDLKKLNCNKRKVLEPLATLIAPFAPHLAEELWNQFGNQATLSSVHHTEFPKADESYLVEDSIEYPVCINGKKRAVAAFASDASKEDMEKGALALEAIQKYMEGKSIKKVIVVPKRMINIVV